MFHLQEGLFFERQQDGSVRIIKTYDGRAVREDNVVMDIKTDSDGFSSIIASMSERGETGETFREAAAFLAKE